MTTAGTLALALAAFVSACVGERHVEAPPPPERRDAEPVAPPSPDLDSLSVYFSATVDSIAPVGLPALEDQIREWLGRLEYEDESLQPADDTDARFFRRYRGQLLDALGWAAFRRGDARQAEAALVSAVREINSRGTTRGYAEHFLHLGQLYRSLGRWDAAVEAFLDAEIRGAGDRATPLLEDAYRRRRGSLRGLDQLRIAERARIEDERRQLLVTDPLSERLPDARYRRRTGPPVGLRSVAEGPFVLAVWDDRCETCPRYWAELAPLDQRLRARGSSLVAVWLGEETAAAGPPQAYTILAPVEPAEARRTLRAGTTPLLLVVDGSGWIRYRWAGDTAMPPPIDDILVQVDHLRRRAGTLRATGS